MSQEKLPPIKFESEFKVEKVEGVATAIYADKDAFYKGTELSKDTIKAVFDHSNNYVESATSEAKDLAQDIMENDKAINSVIVSLPYSPSKKGIITVKANREHTYPGMNGLPDVTKSTLKVMVKDPYQKSTGDKIKEMEAEMTKALLGR